MKRGSWVRSLIFWLVDSWLEGIVVLGLLLILYLLCQSGGDPIVIWILIASALLLIIVSWLLFNIIEVRETLRQIEENTRGTGVNAVGVVNSNMTNNSSQTESASNISGSAQKIFEIEDDEKYCSNCGKIIKKVAKKCRWCGTWFDNNEENK